MEMSSRRLARASAGASAAVDDENYDPANPECIMPDTQQTRDVAQRIHTEQIQRLEGMLLRRSFSNSSIRRHYERILQEMRQAGESSSGGGFQNGRPAEILCGGCKDGATAPPPTPASGSTLADVHRREPLQYPQQMEQWISGGAPPGRLLCFPDVVSDNNATAAFYRYRQVQPDGWHHHQSGHGTPPIRAQPVFNSPMPP